MITLEWVRRDIQGREIILEASETVMINGKPWKLTSVRFAVKNGVPTGGDREGGQTEA